MDSNMKTDVIIQKSIISSEDSLVLCDSNRPIILIFYASTAGVASFLLHIKEDQERPTAFESISLTAAK